MRDPEKEYENAMDVMMELKARDEDMTTEEAADVLRNAAWLGTDAERDQIEKAVDMAINALAQEAWKEEHPVSPLLQKPALTAQELSNNSPKVDNDSGDLISRAAAQTELMMKCERYTLARESHGMGHVEWSDELIDLSDAMDAIRDLPSIQPETHEERTETHACDCISRKAAIDIERNATVDTNPSHFEAHQKFTQFMDDAEISSFGRWQWSNGFNTALTAVSIDLEKLPSAQPEIVRCEDCKHWRNHTVQGVQMVRTYWLRHINC